MNFYRTITYTLLLLSLSTTAAGSVEAITQRCLYRGRAFPTPSKKFARSPESDWLLKNADHYREHWVKIRNGPPIPFSFYTVGAPESLSGYLKEVVPTTASVGFVFGRPDNESQLSKLHTYVRSGEWIYEIDQAPNDKPKKYPVKEYYAKLYARGDKPVFHESVINSTATERDQLRGFYEKILSGALPVQYELAGLGQQDDGRHLVNCFSFSLLFTLPTLNGEFPAVRALVERSGLSLPEDERDHGFIYPGTFGTLLRDVRGAGIVTMGASVLSTGTPPGLHFAEFFDQKKNPVIKKMGVIQDP